MSEKKSMAMFHRSLFMFVLLCSNFAFGERSFIEHWNDPKLSDTQRVGFFLKVRAFYLKHAELFAQDEVLTTRWDILEVAYADENLDCFYGGFPSKRVRSAGRLLCNRPHGLNPAYGSLATQYNCEGTNKYLCNPALFGLGSGDGICLPLRTRQDINNITKNCESSFQTALQRSGKTVEEYLLKKLRDQEEPFGSQWLQTLDSLERQSNCPTKYSWCRLIRKKVQEFKVQLSESTPAVSIDSGAADEPTSLPEAPAATAAPAAASPEAPPAQVSDGSDTLGGLSFKYEDPKPFTSMRSLEGFPKIVRLMLNADFSRYGTDPFAPTYFGYGFLHPESEFQAKEVAQFSCEAQNVQALCADLSSSTGTTITSELLLPTIRPIFLQKLQAKAYEFAAVSLRAGGKSLGEKPSCIEADAFDKLKQLPARYPVDTTDLYTQLRNKNLVQADSELLNKFGAAGQGLNLERILRDVMNHEFLKRVVAEQTQASAFKEEQQERMTFILNSSGPLRAASPSQIAAIMNDVYKLLGATPEAGQTLFRNSNLHLSFEGEKFNEKLAQKLLSNATVRAELTEKLKGVRTSFLNELAADIGNPICEKNVEDLIAEYPSAVRQLLIDDPDSSNFNQYLLCQSAAFRGNIQTSVSTREAQTCTVARNDQTRDQSGITITPRPETRIRVPTSADAPIEVHHEIPIKVGQGHFNGEGINSPRFKSLLATWTASLNDYYNSQTRDFSTLHPGETLPRNVRFSFTFKAVADDPSGATQILECANSQGLSCQEMIQKSYETCVARPTHDPAGRRSECAARRDRMLAAIQAGNYDDVPQTWTSRAFTPGIPPRVLAHEVGHQLGLFDEYKTGMFDSIANDESLMGQGGVLQKRHFDEMIFDLVRCLE